MKHQTIIRLWVPAISFLMRFVRSFCPEQRIETSINGGKYLHLLKGGKCRFCRGNSGQIKVGKGDSIRCPLQRDRTAKCSWRWFLLHVPHWCHIRIIIAKTCSDFMRSPRAGLWDCSALCPGIVTFSFQPVLAILSFCRKPLAPVHVVALSLGWDLCRHSL